MAQVPPKTGNTEKQRQWLTASDATKWQVVMKG